MGLVAGLAWIIFGVCYMAYKFYNEELRMSKAKSVGMVVLGFAVFLGGGSILMALPEAFAGTLLWGALICYGLYRIFGSPAEWQAHQAATERLAGFSQDNGDTLLNEEAAFRTEWFRVNNELLSSEETKFLYREREGVVGERIYHGVPWSQIERYKDGRQNYIRSFIPDDVYARLSQEEIQYLRVRIGEHLFGGGSDPVPNPGIEAACQYIIWQFGSCPVKSWVPYNDVMKNPRLGLEEEVV